MESLSFGDLATTTASHTWLAGGCSLEPLNNYLKALGLLRVLEGARGYWKNGQFWIECDRTLDDAISYIATEHPLTPIFSPWNGDSGFWQGSQSKAAIARLSAFGESPRFAEVRAVRNIANQVIADSGLPKQPSKGDIKTKLVQDLQRSIANAGWQSWFNTVVQVYDDVSKKATKTELTGSRLLGTLGNVGKGADLGANYLEAWSYLIDLTTGQPLDGADRYWQTSITGEGDCKTVVDAAIMAQFSPANDFYYDQKAYPYAKAGSSTAAANPADVVLLTEGLLTFSGAVKRYLESEGSSQAYYSLAVNLAAGSAQTSLPGEMKGTEEIWLPVWESPKSWDDLRKDLFQELQGPLPNWQPDTFDFIEHLVSKADERKIDRWQRYAFFPRKGQTTFAISLGQFSPDGTNLGADLREYRRSIARFATSERAPGGVMALSRRLDQQLSALASGHGSALDTLELLGEIELYLATSQVSQESVRPLPQLSGEWLDRIDDHSPITRLALSLASLWLRSRISQASPGKNDSWYWSERPIFWGPDLTTNLITLRRRWDIDQAQGDSPYPAVRVSPTFSDIAAFIHGGIDEARLMRLAAGFSLCQISGHGWGGIDTNHSPDLITLGVSYLMAAYCQWSNLDAKRPKWPDMLRANNLPLPGGSQREPPQREQAAIAFPLSTWQLQQIKTYYLEA